MRRYRDKDVKPRLQSQLMPVPEAWGVPLLQPHYAKALDTVMIQGLCVLKNQGAARWNGAPVRRTVQLVSTKKATLRVAFPDLNCVQFLLCQTYVYCINTTFTNFGFVRYDIIFLDVLV